MASTSPLDNLLPHKATSSGSVSSERASYFPSPLTSGCPTHQSNYSLPAPTIITIEYQDLSFQFGVQFQFHLQAARTVQHFIQFLLKDDATRKLSIVELASKFLLFTVGSGSTKNACDLEILKSALQGFESRFLKDSDIHTLAATFEGNLEISNEIIKSYYAAQATNFQLVDSSSPPPALCRAVNAGRANVFAIFGGQGNTENYFEELRHVYNVYGPLVDDFIIKSADMLLSLSRSARTKDLTTSILRVRKWLQSPDTTPDTALLITSPLSFPLICLLQLSHFVVACKVLGQTPGEFREYLSGTTGHSQGIISAIVIASADNWDSFFRLANMALTTLFWIGCRSQQIYPLTVLPPEVVEDSMSNGEGIPTPMLSVRDLSRDQLQKHIDNVNLYLATDEQITVSLINNPRNVVIAGPPMSLYALNVRLRQFKADLRLDQTKIPYSSRKLSFSNSFLPITAPFHSKYLSKSVDQTYRDVLEAGVQFPAESLKVPVYHTSTGDDLSNMSGNLVLALMKMIVEEPVDWPNACLFPGATHILDFGPGGLSGVGVLTSRLKEGTGVRVILTGQVSGSNREVGYQPELFGLDCPLKWGVNWEQEYAPRLVKLSANQVLVDTKLSRLLKLPPIVVGGMTPTTVPWDFVAATMNAGYHIELAGGGYHNANDMEHALLQLQSSIPKGRGITINLIYANPQAIAWQIPLVRKLLSEGVPIEGLTFGAGVPSKEVASEFFEMRLKHLTFKPGSTNAIEAVLQIAKAHPSFPIIIQWTGGRAGGHHSCEDFHQPILNMYAKIRRHANVILVAGSGFGGWEDTYPYLTGKWSTSAEYDRPPMPFDGCLFGSRLMVAKETHTSSDAQKAIAATPGLRDQEWEKTSAGLCGAGGIITVISEMGEPIHMLATRGAKLWAELDRMIFSLPNDRRIPILKSKRSYIINKLNADFQKVWFGRNKEGQAVELEQMTYAEVMHRLVDLLVIRRRGTPQWIDKSYTKLLFDFVRRVEERFIAKLTTSVASHKDVVQDPHSTILRILEAYPRAHCRIMISEDAQYFLHLCQRRNQKPVPFISALDDNFQFYFKKDSLWQSEDLDAVVGQDVGRVCILQGPVAVKHSTVIGEPVKQILDSINDGHIDSLLMDLYNNQGDAIPRFHGLEGIQNVAGLHGVLKQETCDSISFEIPNNTKPPSADCWFQLLSGSRGSWRRALFSSDRFMAGSRFQANCVREMLSPVTGLTVEIQHPDEPIRSRIVARQQSSASDGSHSMTIVNVELCGEDIEVRLVHHDTACGHPVELPLRFSYHPEIESTPIHEVMHDRNERTKNFYWRIWFGDSVEPPHISADGTPTTFTDEHVVTNSSIHDFVRTIGNTNEDYIGRGGKCLLAPMDYSIIVAWKAIMKPLFAVDGDLLRLVHLSNQFKLMPGAIPLKKGDVVTAKTRMNAVTIQDSGKVIEVICTLSRLDLPVSEITSRFLYRGEYTDFENTFQNKRETPMSLHLATKKDMAVLRSKTWFQQAHEDESLDKTLIFRLHSTYHFKDESRFSRLTTTGDVFFKSGAMEIPFGKVNFASGSCSGNQVMSYLQRHGVPIEQAVPLQNQILIPARTELLHRFTTPCSNKAYSYASGDFNPIHTSRVFARYSNLPGTITHGMFMSASIRKVLDDNFVGKVYRFTTSFVGMVLPGEEIAVTLQHTAMDQGRKLLKIEARKTSTDELVLTGEAEVEQPSSAYIFTGQGSQAKGMGMDLYETSASARDVWDRADQYFKANYGFAITDIVKNDPKELTIHFGGPRGKLLRQNYLSMTHESISPTGIIKETRIFQNITATSKSYTFRSPLGLLSATQFTQPALTIMAIARFSDLVAKGIIQEAASFAGHSLGEYAALSALGGIMPIEKLVAITWVRGLTMQLGVERDASGRSNFSMCAVNPSKVSLSEEILLDLVQTIGQTTDWLLEIVNFNVESLQYICAGDVRALDCLTSVLNNIVSKKIQFSKLSSGDILDIVRSCAAETKGKSLPIAAKRGSATVPLPQIDVPFHSSYLAGGVDTYRRFLEKKIERYEVDPEHLLGRWIPNLTGKPLSISRDYFEGVFEMTKSKRIGEILMKWGDFEHRRIAEGNCVYLN
ncbi:putative fatty acid synthase subunit beta [Leptodontidium sp. MPI-SDFR-AT-0119]|nr:putative fatty acid synthase subunit beta [Leptodontidium sp. MPI-SDFR-AT-0119]